jgi:protein SCO1/2
LTLLWVLACDPDPGAGTPDAVGVEAREASFYDLDVELMSPTGSTGLDVHRGHPVLLTMFYASCPQVCPMTIGRLQTIDARLSPAASAELRVVLVSLDPARDDVADLAALKAKHGLDARWTVARASENDVRVLSAALGVAYRPTGDGEIHHSSVIALLDGDGVSRAVVGSLGEPVDELVAAIARL